LNLEPQNLVSVVSWGVIGAGDIVRKRVAEALRDGRGCELVAVSRARADLVEAFAHEIGARRGYRGWRDLVSDPEVRAVYVATPVHLHAEQTIAAAEAGKHVLCEKPMAMDVAECDRMMAACRASGVRLGIAYYRRFYPVVRRIGEILESGEIGDPVWAQATAFEPFDPRLDAPRAWLVQRSRSGGGPMADFGCHRLEVLLHLLGPVRRVTSLVSNAVLHREVEDTAAALLQFERGACAMLAVTHAAADRQDTIDLFGTRGSIRAASLNGGDIVVRVGGVERRESHPPPPNVHLPLVEDFVEAVRAGRDPIVDGQIGRTVAVIQGEIYADTPPVR
jgi:predicted dehydrogenase